MSTVKSVLIERDGELISETNQIVRFKKTATEEFMMVYLKDILDIMELLQLVEIKLLHCLWCDCLYNPPNGEGNIVYTTPYNKNRWSSKINAKVTTINTSLSKLEKKGFIKRLATSVYVLNPEYFYKGDRNSRFEIKDKLKDLFNPIKENVTY